MNTLRTQYSRHRKPTPSGSAAKRKTKRQEWLLTALAFLEQYVKKRGSTSNMEVKETAHLY